MQQFLEYSRQLSVEEMDMVAVQDPKGPTKSPPKMEQFREQIDLYEGLYLEIEEMDLSKVFCGWFRVDLRPFRQSVLNTVCKWSSMFKKHLVDRVTTSLSDLGAFIRYFRVKYFTSGNRIFSSRFVTFDSIVPTSQNTLSFLQYLQIII